MWEFIKYCLYCFCGAVSAAFGYNPEGMTFKMAFVGIATMAVLMGLGLGAYWLLILISNKLGK